MNTQAYEPENLPNAPRWSGSRIVTPGRSAGGPDSVTSNHVYGVPSRIGAITNCARFVQGRRPNRLLQKAGLKQVMLVAVAIVIAGCATVDPAQVRLVVEPVNQICGVSDREIPVRVTVRNDSQGKLKVWIDSQSHQPPYVLNRLSYRILDEDGATDWKHGPGGHGPMTPSTLSIGPGDTTEVIGSLYGLAPADYARSFRIQFEDPDGRKFVSGSFKSCAVK
jgi:hypothetical protein